MSSLAGLGLSPSIEKLVGTFVIKLKRRDIAGSSTVARHVAELLRGVISSGKFDRVCSFILLIQVIDVVAM